MMNTEDAKLRVKELVDNYTKLAEEKRIGKYNEEMTKKDFIIPLFEALGWNVYNKPNKTDNVSAEETISKKRVDFGFKINGIPKFLLEAKAIPVDLNKTMFAEQAINYSWHKGCTWAVLTDFEGIKVFNAESSCDDIIPAVETSSEYSSRDVQSNIREVKWTFRTCPAI